MLQSLRPPPLRLSISPPARNPRDVVRLIVHQSAPAVQSMLERGLLELRSTARGPRAFFTEAGLAALRQLVLDRRAMDPERFAHLRVELGLEA